MTTQRLIFVSMSFWYINSYVDLNRLSQLGIVLTLTSYSQLELIETR